MGLSLHVRKIWILEGSEASFWNCIVFFFLKMGFNIMTYVMMFFLFNGISPTKWMRMSDRKVIGDGGDGYGGYGAGSFQFQPLLLLFHQHQELRKK